MLWWLSPCPRWRPSIWLSRPRSSPIPACRDGALEHLADRLTVADLARHAGWAPRTLARHFTGQTGVTPTAYRAAYQGRRPISTDR
jgi:AraC-like DNA-binding protein